MAMVLVMMHRYFILLSLFISGCSGLLFQPMKHLIRTPQQIGLEYQDIEFSSRDGTRLHCWWLPAKGEAKGSILFLHGNAENISTHIGSVYWLPEEGFNVLLLDYRGYGLSKGKPSIPGAIADIESTLQWMENQPGSNQNRIAVLGQSLGGAMGMYALSRDNHANDIRVLILDSVFTDYREIAREKLAGFWLTWPFQYPLSWTLPGQYNPIDTIGKINPTPVLIIHGEMDPIIPVHYGKALYAAAKEPKELWLIANAGHIQSLNQVQVRKRLIEYLNRVMEP
jgi:fermentation-respiration switch protein FrsA (DUF1100 family)